MAALPPLDVAEFPAFFEAVHGYPPFPWQRRLAGLVAEGTWPSVLDLPTGTGKTAALDVALFTLALNADKAPVPLPRRIVFVVDRRTIVDQAYDRALKIRDSLTDSTVDVVQRVRERLASLSVEGQPLHVAQMRGAVARDDRWARTPDQPVIVVSTVDQVGSRLLFRGYGVSDGMKPVHAGLLGHDVLYLLDEVHLSRPFQETLAAIGTRYRGWRRHALPGGFQVVEMSATPGAEQRSGTFSLDEQDRADTILAERLTARKPAALRLPAVPARQFQQELQKQVRAMLDADASTIAVVVNRVASARECHAQLLADLEPKGVDVYPLTGRMRPHDRAEVEAHVLPRIRAGRDRQPDDRPVVIVATQSIEAGADFDFDGLVTECASLDALRQRFGRLDRLGVLRGTARGAIVARTDALKDDAVYGDALGTTWGWLERIATDGVVDFGLAALPAPAADELPALLAPKAHAPVLLPSHLDAWVQTSPKPDPDPDVALWLHGPKRGQADVQVVWRTDLAEGLLLAALDGDRESRTSASDLAIDIVEAVRPSSAEAMSVPFAAARRWLRGLAEPQAADLEGLPVEEDDWREMPAFDRPAVLWQGEESHVIRASELRPGQTIVVPSSYGGIEHRNWAPASTAPVTDVAEIAAWRSGRSPSLRLHPAVLAQYALVPPSPTDTDGEAADDDDVVVAWLESTNRDGEASALRDLVAELLAQSSRLRVERVASGIGDGSEHLVVRAPRPLRASAARLDGDRTTDEGTTGSFTGAMVTLTAHTDGVVRAVEEYARRLGVPAAVTEDLGLAAVWHDAGKADTRFQRWLHGGSEFKALAQAEPLAKSGRSVGGRAMRLARLRAGYPKGARHELMSVALMDASEEAMAGVHDRALVWHMVSSHHGYSRPFAPWIPDQSPVDVTWQRGAVTAVANSGHGLERLDSGVADRFWEVVRAYGWWGTAWLEAIFRLADHRQSEREQLGDTRG